MLVCLRYWLSRSGVAGEAAGEAPAA